MTEKELLRNLKALVDAVGDKEHNHVIADQLLLEFIDQELGHHKVSELFDQIKKWYS